MTLRSLASPSPDPQPAPPAGTGDNRPWTDRGCRKTAAWDVGPRHGAALARKIRELYPELDDPSPDD